MQSLDVASSGRRPVAWLVAGAAALAVAVGFFLSIAHRDDLTLHEGDRTTGEIVGFVQPRDWDFFDCGRLVVRYATDGRTRTARIWIDNDLSDYRVGEQVEVFVRGGHVRTDREPNDPAPWGMAAVVLGLSGAGGLWRGFSLRRPVRAWNVTEAAGRLVLPLAAWRLAPRKAALEVVGGELRLFAPSFFGSHRMVVPLADVGVHAAPAGPDVDVEEPDLWFEDGLLLLDLPTKWQASAPDLVLVFTRPVRVPPLRGLLLLNNPLPVGWRATRSERGEHADGVLLRCPAPDALVEKLVAHGVRRAGDPLEWFAAHRATVQDPARIAVLAQEDEAMERAGKVGVWSWGIATAFAVVARFTDDFRFLVPAGIAAASAFVLPRLIARPPRPKDPTLPTEAARPRQPPGSER